mgnify:CR=1 FL=1
MEIQQYSPTREGLLNKIWNITEINTPWGVYIQIVGNHINYNRRIEMSIVFGFSDESGDYRPKRSENWVGKVPFYVRGTLLIDAENWKELFNRFNIGYRPFL